MEKIDKILLWVAVSVALVLVGASVFKKQNPAVVVVKAGEAGQQTVEVLGASDGSHLETLTVSTLLDVTGSQTNSGALTASGAFTASSGNNRIASLVNTGAVATYTATSTVLAADVCDASVLLITAVSTTPTITLPATSTLFADCLTTDGDFRILNVLNGSSATSSIFAAGTGGTLQVNTTTVLNASKMGLLRIIRDTVNTYKALLVTGI